MHRLPEAAKKGHLGAGRPVDDLGRALWVVVKMCETATEESTTMPRQLHP